MTFKEAVRASIKGDVNAFEHTQISGPRAYDLSLLCRAFSTWRCDPTLVNAINVCTKYINLYKNNSDAPGKDIWEKDPLYALHANLTTIPGRVVCISLREHFPLLGAVDIVYYVDEGEVDVWSNAVDEWVSWAQESKS